MESGTWYAQMKNRFSIVGANEFYLCPMCGSQLEIIRYCQATAQGIGVCTNAKTSCNATFWVVSGETPVVLKEAPEDAIEIKYLFGRFSDIEE